ncbi:hypothetical protein ON010_g13025 [Phytophthora cinnamomi]|nr:hypothetical protein ON010_g13025 [Phytophthora cinnamomi]
MRDRAVDCLSSRLARGHDAPPARAGPPLARARAAELHHARAAGAVAGGADADAQPHLHRDPGRARSA